jgi:Ca2+-binding EF-hand superfamily protein
LTGMTPQRSCSLILLVGILVTSADAQPPGRGGRGGFDPSSFLSRMDANGNGVIDVDEQQGPSKFMLSRLQSYDPSLKVGKPIPLSKITKTFEKARAAREGGRGYDRRDRGRGNDREREEREIADKSVTVEPLVPGFGDQEDALSQLPLQGFGAQAELLLIEVTEEDQETAASRIRSFDKNKNGVLEKNEFTRDFAGNPMDFDRNRDGRLTKQELAVRYAVRREGNEKAKRQRANEQSREKEKQEKKEDRKESDPFNGRRSYRVNAPQRTPEGLPGYFTDRDQNGDGQISMAEFSSDWSDEVVAEFFGSDFNRDGVITTDEALRVVEGESATDSPKPMPVRDYAAKSKDKRTEKESGKPKSSNADAKIDSKTLKYSERIVKRNDKNKDGVLTPSEWKEMLMSPAKADFNRDGKVTVEEYAMWLQNGKK